MTRRTFGRRGIVLITGILVMVTALLAPATAAPATGAAPGSPAGPPE